ncbi:MAG: inositol monophosphatase family protein [Alphaproteobacteria bacterium]|nr:inositol monophosphatase family protein [Alphaproteobacteria bacterium]MCZ6764404.1 inositol monophosphatase family protein [Alphaproteobacteria bacterium]
MIKPPLISVIDRAARKAGRALVRDFGEVEQLQVSRKGAADFVSAADTRAEQTLHEELARARPDFGFLGEEGGERRTGNGPSRWIVDPLDGTLNFLHGLPHFAISIAVETNGEIVAGGVYAPLTDDLYWAERNEGAYLGDRRMRVSARHRLADCIVATGIPFKEHGQPDRFVAELEILMGEVAGIRHFGSASLDLAYVASGRYDGFWERELQPWDMAAGILIVREAGGLVTDLDGGLDMLRKGHILAANGDLHDILLAKLRRVVHP